jgi:hypothetical protein
LKNFPFANAVVSAFVHATEEKDKVMKAMAILTPKGVEVNATELEGYHGNPISLLECRIAKKAVLREWWVGLAEKLDAGIERIRLDLPENIDDSCRLYLRFDKQRAYSGELVLTVGEDVVHVRLKVVTWPARREAAVSLVEEFLSG